jgi:hypothetical protein
MAALRMFYSSKVPFVPGQADVGKPLADLLVPKIQESARAGQPIESDIHAPIVMEEICRSSIRFATSRQRLY